MPAPASLPASHFVISQKQTTFVAKYLAMSYERKIINDPVFGFINIPKGLLYNVLPVSSNWDYPLSYIPARNTPGSSIHSALST